ncbi:hypothetical protein DY000_02019582 [Brassica cretica]|uniref:Uncharacterized protein n=1 Tax=Brassica cretica TaxID=69181 RepID=A0ABQ7CYU6_BRACR|nr:hypothetical protein DY000_02019582 [Brassica cretica]
MRLEVVGGDEFRGGNPEERAGRKGLGGRERQAEGLDDRQRLLTEGSGRKHGQGHARRFALEFVSERVLREIKLPMFSIVIDQINYNEKI